MKCDEFLSCVESGGILRRFAARRHAKHCSRCAMILGRWLSFKQELSRPELIDSQARLLWQRAANAEPKSNPLRAIRKRRFALMAAAAAAAIAVAAFLFLRDADRRPIGKDIAEGQKNGSDRASNSVPVYTLPELAEMERGLDKLSGDLDRLDRMAALLDARKRAEELVSTYRTYRSPVSEPQRGSSG